MIKSYLIGLVGAATLTAAPALAATYTTVDLTAIDGTSWESINSLPVRIDFGAGFGAGTVTLTSVNGGGGSGHWTPVPDGAFFDRFDYTQSVGAGDTLVSTTNGTGYMAVDTPEFSPNIGLSGFELTFTLDSGNFLAGSMFLVGGLQQKTTLNPQSYFSPGDEFGTPLSTLLTSVGTGGAAGSTPMVQVGSDSFGPLYSAAGATGVTETQAFALAGNTNTFSVRMLTDPRFSKSHAAMNMSFATVDGTPVLSAVPEPATWAMMIVGFGLAGTAIRGRRASESLRSA